MATQKGRNWSSGDIVTAANLSSIERGVSAVAEEYTPTTWANGNTVTAAALNNIEQGIANAGGGSSDFSTAEVTVVNGGMITLPVTQEADPSQEVPAYLMVVGQMLEAGTYSVPLYKGGLMIDLPIGATVSGNIQEAGMGYLITGDCTITISGGIAA